MPPKPRNALTFTVESTTTEQIGLTIQIGWQAWSGLLTVLAVRADLATFASQVRDFASHQRLDSRFQAGSMEEGILDLTIAEYGRARKAAVGIHLAHADSIHGRLNWPMELRLQLPTEHGLLGEFGADLAQLIAADSGTATLRLLPKWPS